jgi:predicted alpha/beta superfamily hydrolase
VKKFTWLILIATLLTNYQKGNGQAKHLFEIGAIDSIYSDILEESREIYIQLPDNYDPESQVKYPVVYVLDGDVLLNAVSTVYSFYWGGFMPEMIIVGISNGEHRTRDLTPSEITTKYGMPFNEENGGADNFTQFIVKELIPFIERNYAVSDHRTLIGHSYAGLFTINMLMNHTEVFDNYLAIDPSLDWDDQKLLKQSEEAFRAKSFEGKSLFLSLGGILHMQKEEVTIDNIMEDTSDYTLFARSNIEFSKLVQDNPQNDLAFRWKFYEKDYHGTIPLPSILEGLIYLFEWYQMEYIQEFNDPETPKEVLSEIVKYRANKLSDHFGYVVPPYPQDLLEMLGYMNLQMGQPEKSLMFFQLNIDYYPGSPNAYDSIADYYVEQNDYENALKYVTKAYEISGEDYHKERIKELETKKRGG